MFGASIVHEKLAMEKPLAAAVKMTCSPKLNLVAATGDSERLSADAVMVSEPPLAQAAAIAGTAAAKLLSTIAAERKKRDGVIWVSSFLENSRRRHRNDRGIGLI